MKSGLTLPKIILSSLMALTLGLAVASEGAFIYEAGGGIRMVRAKVAMDPGGVVQLFADDIAGTTATTSGRSNPVVIKVRNLSDTPTTYTLRVRCWMAENASETTVTTIGPVTTLDALSVVFQGDQDDVAAFRAEIAKSLASNLTEPKRSKVFNDLTASLYQLRLSQIKAQAQKRLSEESERIAREQEAQGL